MKKIFIYALSVLAGIAALSACTKNFEDLNRPGGNLSKEELSRDGWALMSFIQQLENEAFPEQENTYQMNVDLIGNYCGRFMTHANPGFSNNNFQRMNAPEGWARYPFADCTPKVASAMREIASRVDSDNAFYAWALVVRAASLLRLTDIYGPFPVGEDSKYSSQKDVYYSLLADLDHATSILGPLVAANPSLTMGDPAQDRVYAGNMAQWVRYANSLKLRMAVRMRFADPSKAKEVAEAAVSAGVITDNADNCKTNYRPNGQYKTSVEWGDSRVCADIESYMTGYNDPREGKYFSATETAGSRPYIGCPAAATITNKAAADALYSAANVTAETDGVWLTAAEVAFCRAEGALAGWEMGGTAKTFYEKGIALSFEQWGAGSADDYIADSSSLPANYSNAASGFGRASYARASNITIAWNESASDEVKLERIITQKWIALYPEGQEAWCEIRRTGYPKVFPLATTSVTGEDVPNRVPFDPREATNNRENYLDAVTLLGGPDSYTTKMWWQR